VAIKSIDLKIAEEKNMSKEDIINEVKILKEMTSPYVMRLIEHVIEPF